MPRKTRRIKLDPQPNEDNIFSIGWFNQDFGIWLGILEPDGGWPKLDGSPSPYLRKGQFIKCPHQPVSAGDFFSGKATVKKKKNEWYWVLKDLQ